MLQAACNFLKTEALARVFCYEFCEISKTNFSYRTKMALKGYCSLPWFLVECSQNLAQSSEVLNNSGKFLDSSGNSSQDSRIVLGRFEQFSESSTSSRKHQTVLEQASVSKKSHTVLGGTKQLQAVSKCPRSFRQLSVFCNTFYHLSLFSVAFVDCCQISLQSSFLLPKLCDTKISHCLDGSGLMLRA